MTVFSGSRYRFGNTIQITDASGEVAVVHKLRETTVEPPNGSELYVTLAGDTMESLAFRRYGDANKWYVIADANPKVFWPLDLQPGTQIIIPTASFAATQ